MIITFTYGCGKQDMIIECKRVNGGDYNRDFYYYSFIIKENGKTLARTEKQAISRDNLAKWIKQAKKDIKTGEFNYIDVIALYSKYPYYTRIKSFIH